MKGQLASSVTATIAGATAIFVGIWVLSMISGSVTLPSETHSVSLEEITFTTNNTFYATTGTSINSPQLYYFNNVTYPIPASKWTTNTAGVKIYDNNTDGAPPKYPNVTAGEKYYLSYGWSRSDVQANNTFATVQTVTWNAMQLLAVALVVVAAAVILAYFGVGQFGS